MQAVVANNTCYILNPTVTTNPANSNSNKTPENFKINQPQHALKYKKTVQEHKQNISFNEINPN